MTFRQWLGVASAVAVGYALAQAIEALAYISFFSVW